MIILYYNFEQKTRIICTFYFSCHYVTKRHFNLSIREYLLDGNPNTFSCNINNPIKGIINTPGFTGGTACRKTNILKNVAQTKSFGRVFSKARRAWGSAPKYPNSVRSAGEGAKTVHWTVFAGRTLAGGSSR